MVVHILSYYKDKEASYCNECDAPIVLKTISNQNIINFKGKSKEYIKGYADALENTLDVVVTKSTMGTEIDYKKAFEEMYAYFDSISDEEKPKLDKILKLHGV